MDQDDNDESSSDVGMQEDVDETSDSGGIRGRNAHSPTAADFVAESDSEVEMFDIGLAATHSYLDGGMVTVRGRNVLEAGWTGRVPVVAHHGCVFPGETVPMLLPDPEDAALITQIINRDHLFGLLCPDAAGRALSGYGVLCEVYEAGAAPLVSLKARATHRFVVRRLARLPRALAAYARLRHVEVLVLGEAGASALARTARPASLAPLAAGAARSLEAALSPWPRFVHELFEYSRMRATLRDHFRALGIEKLPSEPVSLSFWVASNLVLSARDRLALFVVDNALLRLHIECHYIKRGGALCCAACLAQVARTDQIMAMSSEGVHSNYVNLGGFVHDVVTVRAARRVALSGAPSAAHSWFPGYAWTIASCAGCGAHLGWRFTALSDALRPAHFYGLCRNYIEPRHDRPSPPSPPA